MKNQTLFYILAVLLWVGLTPAQVIPTGNIMFQRKNASGPNTLINVAPTNGALTFDSAGGGTFSFSAYQPLDSDLTSIAALTTTSAGRLLLECVNASPATGDVVYFSDATHVSTFPTSVLGRDLMSAPSTATVINSILPSQTGNSGKFLTTNGTVTSWGTVATGLTIGTTAITSGTDGRILYDNAGTVGEKAVTGTGSVVLSASPTFTGTLTAGDYVYASQAVQAGANGGDITTRMDYNSIRYSFYEEPTTYNGVLQFPASLSASGTWQLPTTYGTIVVESSIPYFAGIDIRNSTTATYANVYRTYSSTTNYERIGTKWVSTTGYIGTEKGSSGGTARNLALMTDGTARWTINATTGALTGTASINAGNVTATGLTSNGAASVYGSASVSGNLSIGSGDSFYFEPAGYVVWSNIDGEYGKLLYFTGSDWAGGTYAFTLPNQSGQLTVQEWRIKTTTYTAVKGDKIQANTASAAWTLTLPASATAGDCILIEDAALTWGTNALTIDRNGLKINGAASNYSANVIGGKLSCVYINATIGWSIK